MLVGLPDRFRPRRGYLVPLQRGKQSGKKNDYDYAYYDNTAGLEYDSLDLEHVTGNKESTKIARN